MEVSSGVKLRNAIAPPNSGTLVTVTFTSAMKLLDLFKPKPTAPNIDIYGQPIGMEPDQVQALMEWLFASLMAAGYFGKSHFIWYDSDKPDPRLEQEVKKLLKRGEPVVLYRCGGRSMPLPQGYYWRMMPEHPSMRVYQLEVKE